MPEDPRRLLDDIASMSIADIDRERLVNRYLDALIRIVEPGSVGAGVANFATPEKSPQSRAGGRS